MLRPDFSLIANIVGKEARVLDLGCGDGELMAYLATTMNSRVQGIELDEAAIYKCVEKGLNVFHSDIDSGLKGYPDKAFDYVILNQSIQQVKRVSYVIEESLRTGTRVIVSFPNFAHIRSRLKLVFGGKVPITRHLPYSWHDTPNLRFLSIKDFRDYCREKNITILNAHFLGASGEIRVMPNVFAENALFVLTR